MATMRQSADWEGERALIVEIADLSEFISRSDIWTNSQVYAIYGAGSAKILRSSSSLIYSKSTADHYIADIPITR